MAGPLTYSSPDGNAAQHSSALGTDVERPRTVVAALGLYLLKVLVMIVSFIALVGHLGAASAAARRTESGGVTQQQLHGITVVQLHAYTSGILIGAVVLSGLYLLAFVFFVASAGRGANWARVVLLVLTCVGVLETGLNAAGLFQDPVRVLGLLGTVAGVVATILLFVPASRQYFEAVTARKRSRASVPRPVAVSEPPSRS